MNTPKDIDNILARHFSGESLLADEQTALADYQTTHAEEYRRVEALQRALTADDVTLNVDVEAAWQKVETCLSEPQRRPLLRRLYPVLAVAASLLLLVGIGLRVFRSVMPQARLYANNALTDTTVVLPDGSYVVLASSASMEYAENSAERHRTVTLKGKAFFDVRHDGRAFSVEAGNLRVDVLGTSFKVDVTDKACGRVSVSTGRVQVSTGRESMVLTRGEQVKVKDGRIGKKERTPEQPDEVVTFVFDAAPIREAVARVEKEMDVEIRVSPTVSSDNKVTTRMQITSPAQAVREFAMLCGCRYDSISPLRYILYK